MNQINLIDLFCGAGGFSAGLSLSSDDFTVVGGIDMEESAVDTFNANHPHANGVVGDISSISPNEFAEQSNIKQVDLIIGGPPCKGFTSIRPNRSSDEIDYRNYLYQDYLNYVEHFQPEMFVLENVPAIINHTINDENILTKILQDIEDLGYKYEWKMLNSAFYGTPQARTRFILIGVKNPNTEISFPTPTHSFHDEEIQSQRLIHRDHTITPEIGTKKPVVTTLEAISDLPYIEAGETLNEYETEPQNEFQQNILTTPDGKLLTGTELTQHRATNHSDEMVEILKEARFGRSEIPEDLRPPTGYEATYSRQYPDQPSTTLTTEYTTAGATRCVHPDFSVARALTVREGMRLQSFPDWYEFCGTKTSLTEQVGNAVPPLLAKNIGKTVQQTLKQQNN
jgi:DNA (cytosine-5)-methyltransferase 1